MYPIYTLERRMFTFKTIRGDLLKKRSEKYFKIIDSAIREFADKGYEAASTNNIAKIANVSKGLIFKYFGNKENLYIESLIRAIEIVKDEFENFLSNSNKEDFFILLKEWSLRKIQIFHKNPVLSKFLLTILDIPEELFKKIQFIYEDSLKISASKLFDSFLKLPIRDDLPKEKVFDFLMILLQSIGNKYIREFYKHSDRFLEKKEELLNDFDLYLEIIKNGILSKTNFKNS